jgi:hypothetical protein
VICYKTEDLSATGNENISCQVNDSFEPRANFKVTYNFSVFVVIKHVKALLKFEAIVQGQDGREINSEITEFF